MNELLCTTVVRLDGLVENHAYDTMAKAENPKALTEEPARRLLATAITDRFHPNSIASLSKSRFMF